MVAKRLFLRASHQQGGSWLDFEFDAKNMFYVRIDRKRKMLLTSFLSALASDAFPDDGAVGMSREEMVARLYGSIDFVWQADKGLWSVGLSESLLGRMGVLDFDLVDAKKGVVLAAKGTKVDKDTIQGWGRGWCGRCFGARQLCRGPFFGQRCCGSRNRRSPF